MSRHISRQGVTLVEVILGLVVLGLTLTGGAVAFQNLVQAETSTRTHTRVDEELQNVAEQIRYQTAGAFDTMTSTSPALRPTSSKNVQVFATIAPIDFRTRTRDVNLTASWKEKGVTRTKTTSFSVSQMRSKVAGGLVAVQALDVTTNAGIPGVQVSARGQDIAFVSGQTDSAGIALLAGVKLNATATEAITIDGSPVLAYHDVGTGQAPNSTRSFLRTYLVSSLSGTQTNLTVPMVAPGHLVGTVRDETGAPVPDAHIYLYAKTSTQDIYHDLSSAERFQRTDSSGNYIYPQVVGGRYWVYMVGDGAKTMAALDIPNGHYGYDSGNDVSIPTGLERRVDFTTIRRGNAAGTAWAVRGNNAGQFFRTGATAANVGIRFQPRDAHIVSLQGYPSTQDFSGSFAWGDWGIRSTYSSASSIDTTADASGAFKAQSVAPFLVNIDDVAYPHALHYGNALSVPADVAPAPYLPVLAYAPNGFSTATSSVTFLVAFNPWWHEVRPRAADESVFQRKIMANSDNNANAYFLTRDVLANVHGRIFFSNGTPFTYDGDVSINNWTPNAPANVDNTGGFRSDQNRFDDNYTVGTTRDGSGKVIYDLRSNGNNAILPNLGSEITWLQLSVNVGGPITSNKTFTDTMKAYTKVQSGSSINYVAVSASAVNMNNATVNCYEYGGALRWTTTVNVNNAVLLATNRSTVHYNYYNAAQGVALKPGEDKALDLTVGPLTEGGFQPYYLTVTHNQWVHHKIGPSWGTPFGYFASADQYKLADPYNYPLELRQVLTAASVSGVVTDAVSGVPLSGVTLTLHRSTGNGADDAPFGALTTTSNNAGQYSFTGIQFVADPNRNLSLTATLPGYNNSNEYSWDAYDGISITQNISLGITGSGGGGGSGL